MEITKSIKKMLITVIAAVMMINIIPAGVFADSGSVIASGKLGKDRDPQGNKERNIYPKSQSYSSWQQVLQNQETGGEADS